MTYSFRVFNEAPEPLAINRSPHPYFPTGDFRPTTMLLYSEVWRTMTLVSRAVATLLNFVTIRRLRYSKEFWPVLRLWMYLEARKWVFLWQVQKTRLSDETSNRISTCDSHESLSKHDQRTLLSLKIAITECIKCKATDPRDKVFAH